MSLLQTPLYEWHSTRSKMVPFAGFSMPVVYNSPSSISKEHNSIRNNAGIFDVSHMGRLLVSGDDALTFLNLLVPRDLSKLPLNKVAYTYFLNELGGFRDDITIARTDEKEFLVTWNAGNLWKIWHWITELEQIYKSGSSYQFTIEHITFKTAMFAFQGPNAPKIVEKLFGVFPGSWKIAKTIYKEKSIYIFGSGYTGEAGCEIIVFDASIEDPTNALMIWETLLGEDDVIPCGLGARDTLRTEAGMPLYGNEITEDISPIEAGLGFPPLLNFDKEFFVGKAALQIKLESKHDLPKRVGLIALKKGRAPRPGMYIYQEGVEIGHVTSGSFSPLLNVGIGMGYVSQQIQENSEVILKDKDSNRELVVKIVKFPLYDSSQYGSKRNQS